MKRTVLKYESITMLHTIFKFIGEKALFHFNSIEDKRTRKISEKRKRKEKMIFIKAY